MVRAGARDGGVDTGPGTRVALEVWGVAPQGPSLRCCWPSSLCPRCTASDLQGPRVSQRAVPVLTPRHDSGGPRPPEPLRWPWASRGLGRQRLCGISGPPGGGQGRVRGPGFLSQSSPEMETRGSCLVTGAGPGGPELPRAFHLSRRLRPLSPNSPQTTGRAPLPGAPRLRTPSARRRCRPPPPAPPCALHAAHL